MVTNSNIRLAFYGDDFTGSTDALEFVAKAGGKAVLFINTPTPQQLAAFPGLDVIGVAGKTRALSAKAIEEELTIAFACLKQTGAKHIHYKICSTFDSSPAIGSIGKAMDVAAAIFNNTFIPVIGGNPLLGRYCVFGNLFARMGIGSQGEIYRLDRHPSMSRHPVTPADESDLRLHLAKQTAQPIGLINITQLQQPVNTWPVALTDKLVLVDLLHESELLAIGTWLEEVCYNQKPLFTVGSSSVSAALGIYWNTKKSWQPKNDWPLITRAKPLLVISGSCSPVTATQIKTALANGFTEIIVDTGELVNNPLTIHQYLEQLNKLLQQQQHVIVHTGIKQATNLPSEKIGTALGIIARQAAENDLVKRVVLSGGDSSSYAARAMEITAVEMVAPLISGAPLCKAFSANKKINGMEVNFKGGQVGAEDYFLRMMLGNENHE